MFLREQEVTVPTAPGHRKLLAHLARETHNKLGEGAVPIRFAVTQSDDHCYNCEVGVIADSRHSTSPTVPSVFQFQRRAVECAEQFNAVLLVPTGIGAEIGGHAGDAGPVARMLSATCDNLITHPNVVNASDINEIPENGLYVEGSIICRLLMGTCGLQKVRSNRVLVVLDAHEDELFVNAAINSVSASRAACGMSSAAVVQLERPLKSRTRYTSSGSATGRVEGLEPLWEVLEHRRRDFDAVAISSVIDVPPGFHQEYFKSKGEMVNPWGGVEALLTHAVSTLYDVPSAHAPMLENRDIAYMNIGRVDPRMAAEAVSLTFLQCVLKGLQRSPRIVTDRESMRQAGVMTAADVSCLVIPDGCLGLPTLAALEQGIPVIAVRENKNLMQNDLTALPWARGQLHVVENYWEAGGVMLSLKAGIEPGSVRRPLVETLVEKNTAPVEESKELPFCAGRPERS